MKLHLPLVVLLVFTSSVLVAQNDTGIVKGTNPPMIKYGADDFGGNSQIWDVIQNDQGLIYAASFGGILEFDGNSWQVINQTLMQCFDSDSQGRIYAGGYAAIGYLDKGEDGSVEYTSLLEKLPDNVGDVLVRNIHQLDGKVYFISHGFVCIYDPATDLINIIRSELQLFPSYLLDDRIVVMVDQKGLCEISGDTLKPLVGGTYWSEMKIDNMVPFEAHDFMTLSSKYGAHIYLNGEVMPSDLFDQAYFSNNQLFGAKRLASGGYALCFLTGGLVLTDSNFEIKLVLDKYSDINNQVHNVYQDKEENLWVSTNDGLIYLNITSPIGRVNKVQGLEGSVNDVVNYNDDSYINGYAGTFYRKNTGNLDLLDPEKRFFKKVGNSEIGGIELLASDQWLFSAHTRKKGVIINNNFVPLLENNNTYHAAIAYVPEDQVILSTKETGNELEIFKMKNNRWIHAQSIVDDRLPTDLVHSIVYDSTQKWFWSVSIHGTVFRFRLNENYDRISDIQLIDESLGLPRNSQNKVFKLEDKVLLATSNGLMYFDEDENRMSKDERFGDFFDEIGLFSLAKENDNSYWYVATNQELGHLIINPETSAITKDISVFSTINTGTLTDYLEMQTAEHLGIGTLDGLLVVQTNKLETTEFKFDPIIRSVKIIQTDSVIFNGHMLENEHNSLNFRYAAPFYKGVSKILYRTKLEGFERKWSDWTEKSEQDFTNIPFGEYSFSVQAKNVFNRVSQVSSFEFRVKPPAYLAWWAILIYIIILLIIIVVIVKINARRLILKNQELEDTIKDRVAEIENQKNVIAQSLLEKESLLKEIHHRVKNNLQIIASLLYLQSGKFENEDFKKVLEEGQGRVRSMALIHQKLYENDDLKSIPFEEYLLELVHEIKSSFGMHHVELDIKAEHIFFDVDTAVPLGLIVNELATNAFKYAFDEGSAGSFSISLTKEGNTYKLNVQDSGKGLPEEIDIKKTRSLGLRLVRMLSQQLEGDFQFESMNGTKFSLKFAA